MNTLLLLFFALPIAIIILSIVLLRILKCPILVAATFFAILLVVSFIVDGTGFLIFVIAYTILSYITAVITRLICNIIERINRCCNNEIEENNQVALANITSNNNNNCNQQCCRCNSNNDTSNNNNQARFTLTTNQANPVLFLTNRNSNSSRRNGCCCGRR